ncbi:hypothetical protein QN277_017777 [Acacia crassicarpa]|uniref:GATA-type domain-containing protein n=1 Tax=Acacia crassicarpa TaxID=499986 RepID=A0AAE1JS06_9FABA|nr:hypothetical protein QN277_017777 [Acacia crassicarpa]
MDIGKQRQHDQEADMDDWSSVRVPKHEKDKEEINRSSISGHKDSSSAKWKCSDQMWVMRKSKECQKASSYSPTWQQYQRGRRPSNNTNRVCSDCSTTSTPLWRSGPNGPKSLCNACGIRQRKARKAMEAEGRGWCAKTRIMHNNKRQVMKNKTDYECRGKMKVTLRDFEFTFSRNSVVFQQLVFPRDEVIEGAMLLMDLSYGLFPF